MTMTCGGCEPVSSEHEQERKELPGYDPDFRTFTFRGHDYIWFTQNSFESTADWNHGGVVHDPDCKKCTEGTVGKVEKDNLSEYERVFGRN